MTINCVYQGQRKTFSFESDEVIVGRAKAEGTPTLRLDKDLRVSRQHARFFENKGAVFIEDLGSRGGVFVNHARIVDAWELPPGDAIKIGETVLTLELEATMVDDGGEFVGTLDASLPARRFQQQRSDDDGSTMVLRKDDFEDANVAGREEVKIENQLDAWNRAMSFFDEDAPSLQERLKALYDLPFQFAVEEEPDHFFKLILKRALELIPEADRGSILSYDSRSGKLAMRYCIPEADEPPVSRTLVKQAAADGNALIWSWKDPADGNLQCGIYAPLIWADTVIGMLYVDSPGGLARPFSNLDMKILLAIANYAAMVLRLRGW